MQNPETPEQWQKAVNLADLFLTLEAAKTYGLIYGGPEIDMARCIELLRQGETMGILPQTEQKIDQLIRELFDEVARIGQRRANNEFT